MRELLLSRPAGLEVFLEGLGIQTCSDIRHMWSSGQALVGEFEARSGKLSADEAFSVAALWTLALSRATTQGHKGIAAIVEDRTSTFSRNVAPRPEPGQPSKIITYHKLIQAGGTPAQPSLAQAWDGITPEDRQCAPRQLSDPFLQRFWKLFQLKQGELALTDQQLLPRGSWTWQELAAANDRMAPLEIGPTPCSCWGYPC